MSTDRGMACAVCGLMVDRIGPRDRDAPDEGYTHTLADPDDHPVVPVSWRDIKTNIRCDFCLVDNARWALPVEDYELGMGHLNVGDWAACDGCADALRANDWNKVIYRARRAHETLNKGSIERESFEWLYRQLRTHVTGKVHLRADLL